MTRMHPGFVRAPELLPVPRPDPIHPEQVAGRACVWCAGEPTIPLGTRLTARLGRVGSWAPTACQDCAALEAGRVHAIHVRSCYRCRAGDSCPDARALRHLAAAPRLRPAAGRPDAP